MATIVKATKITKSTPQTAQLEAFVSSLGVEFKTELYLCNQQAYINANLIMPILSVTEQWFLANSESPLHYIKVKTAAGKSSLYINKYGMTKLLGQSKEAVSFRLQDYLYELLYRVETQESVSKEDVVSRKQLIKMSEDLEMYQTAITKSTNETIELKESNEMLRYEYANADIERTKLKNEIAVLHESVKDLEEEVSVYKTIANKLARYVRIKSKNPPGEAYDDSLEEEYLDTEEIDEVTELKITSDAIKAKSQLKQTTKRVIRKPIVATPPPTTKPYVLLRSAEGSFCDYKWALSDVIVTEDFKEQSKDYNLGEIDSPPAHMIWYEDLQLSDEKEK